MKKTIYLFTGFLMLITIIAISYVSAVLPNVGRAPDLLLTKTVEPYF